ncbi:MAG: hypothetical protein ACJATI_003727 [Halioglobus sp.]|jgi:hypothetical protein
MRKLVLKDSISFYVHIFFIYQCILLFIIPFIVSVFNTNLALYILGYGIFYVIGFYFMSWIIVPFLLMVYNFLFSKLGLLKSSIIIFCIVSIISIWGYDFFNLIKSNESRLFFDISTSPLFLWVIFLIKEHDFK